MAEPPSYIEFGGLDTFPGPYDCRQTTLYSFMVMADMGALERLVELVLTRPTLGAAEFRPLAPMVMLSVGDIAHVVPLTPPYNSYGNVNEAQLAVWVPVVQVSGKGAERKAKNFWMFTSYIWVDNPDVDGDRQGDVRLAEIDGGDPNCPMPPMHRSCCRPTASISRRAINRRIESCCG